MPVMEPARPALEPPAPAESNGPPNRAIRSFVVRAGRMTTAQQRAWKDCWPRFGIEVRGEPVDLDATFGRHATRVLEIGFGNGDSLLELATGHPERDHVGIEVHPPGVGHLLLRAEATGLANVRVICADAVEVLRNSLVGCEFDEVLLYFPDPWPKKRHHKRRIVQPAFVEVVVERLRPGGVFRLATDWEPYAEHMLETLLACARLRNAFRASRPPPRPRGPRPRVPAPLRRPYRHDSCCGVQPPCSDDNCAIPTLELARREAYK
jgi:tRNA (guanine-N7-)-methyltransferase